MLVIHHVALALADLHWSNGGSAGRPMSISTIRITAPVTTTWNQSVLAHTELMGHILAKRTQDDQQQ